MREPAPPPEQTPPHPRAMQAILRGARKRCPRCGEREVFASWFKLRPACPRCRFVFEREEGAFLGSMTINYAVTGLAGLAYMALVLIFARSAPKPLLIAGGLAILAIVPALVYPVSKTLWAAIDLLAFKLEHQDD